MRAVNAAYRVLSDARQRATYDARRFVRPAVAVASVPGRPRARPVVFAPEPPPTALQRRVDRIVAVVGVIVLILVGAYAALIIPRTEQDNRAHPSNASVSERLRSDIGLRTFPGTVLVAPPGLAPFADLPILRIDATGQGIARYAVYYGDLTTGVATISGLTGRDSFDASLPRLPGCTAEATYCAGPGTGQTAADAPGVELFRSPNLVASYPAYATHRVCCNGLFWSLNWYEPGTNMSYTIDLSRNVAAQFGGSAADDDVAAARKVAALATQLVRLP